MLIADEPEEVAAICKANDVCEKYGKDEISSST
jgi:hypothetical protein